MKRSPGLAASAKGVLTVVFVLLALSCFVGAAQGENSRAEDEAGALGQPVPVLVYHRFGPAVSDGMTVTTSVFESHLKYLKEKGYTVITLRRLVDYYLRKGPRPPEKSVVITVDDGHRSVYTEMFPLVKKYNVPVTLFIYPSAISNASYAMTWDQLRELKRSGLFYFGSHTYWHPNFRIEKRRLASGEYEEFVEKQMVRSRKKLGRELGTEPDMLAWPFGICDEDLAGQARAAGYVAGFTLERRRSTIRDNMMTLPRYLMTDSVRGGMLENILGGPAEKKIPR